MNSRTHIVLARNANGDRLYYTGRAGERWISWHKAEAFLYSIEGAERKVAKFNEWQMVHGLRFYTVEIEPQD